MEMNISNEADQLVREAVRRRLRGYVDAAVEQAFEAEMTADVHTQIAALAEDLVVEQLAVALTPDDPSTDHPDSADAAADTEDADEAEPPQLVFTSLAEFVTDKLAPTYRREVAEGLGRRWCPEWWRHAEATSRLEALWRAWEHLRLDPATGMSVWWRDHADHHMEKLFDPDGPFKSCSVRDGHKKPGQPGYIDPLPVTEEPSALFTQLPVPAGHG